MVNGDGSGNTAVEADGSTRNGRKVRAQLVTIRVLCVLVKMSIRTSDKLRHKTM